MICVDFVPFELFVVSPGVFGAFSLRASSLRAGDCRAQPVLSEAERARNDVGARGPFD